MVTPERVHAIYAPQFTPINTFSTCHPERLHVRDLLSVARHNKKVDPSLDKAEFGMTNFYDGVLLPLHKLLIPLNRLPRNPINHTRRNQFQPLPELAF
jgi:hypothetical protein